MSMATARDFRKTRLSIALAVSDGEQTLYEISRAVGRPSGSISRQVQSMVSERLLIADPDPPVRGTMYRLNPDVRDALEEAAEGSQQPGLLVPNQRLLLVRGGPGRTKSAQLLAKPGLSGAVAWSVRIDASGGLLLAMSISVDNHQVDKLVVALEESGFECREGLVGEIESGRDLRARSKSLAEIAEGVR